MIGYLEGTVRLKRPGTLVILTAGVGRPVHVSQPTFLAYGLGDQIELMIETKVSETDVSFYGFETEAEQDLFVALCKIPKIGGKLAMAILGALGHDGFCRVIAEKDDKAMKGVKGVGPAMVKHLMADSGLQKFVDANYQPDAEAGQKDATYTLVMNAMKAMGYAPAEMDDLVRKTISDVGADKGAPILISEVLKRRSAQAA